MLLCLKLMLNLFYYVLFLHLESDLDFFSSFCIFLSRTLGISNHDLTTCPLFSSLCKSLKCGHLDSSCTVVQFLVLLPCSKKGSNPIWNLSAKKLYVLYGSYSFIQHPRSMHVRLISHQVLNVCTHCCLVCLLSYMSWLCPGSVTEPYR